ncbi:hypothetical protein ACGFXC_37365 [Streptomyces sp. NPDC048507]|uniref:hypothetical protein n=1 Tax=Streptomyces sp. NPDC048507 TaxID=3365560 RepID=UPI00371AE80A
MAAQHTAGLRGVAGEVRAVGNGMGPVWVVLTRGSVRLLGLGCRCLGALAGGIWRAVSLDPTREAQARAKAVKAAETRQRKRAAAAKKARAAAAKAAAADLDDDDDLAEDDDECLADDEVPKTVVLSAQAETAIRAASARPLWEALALLGLGGAVTAVGVAVLVQVVAGPAAAWGGQVWDSWSGLITTGALTAWTTGALMAGPSLAEAEAIRATRWAARSAKQDQDQDQDHEEEPAEDEKHAAEQEEQQNVEQEEEQPVDRGTVLMLHVLRALADAEAARRAGVHLDIVLASASAAGLVSAGTEVPEFRQWVERVGLPTKEIGMRIGGRPVTRVGVRVDMATEVLGMAPGALLRARSEASVRPLGEAPVEAVRVPAQPVGETPAEPAANTPAAAPVPAPDSTPAAAVLRLIPGGLLDPGQDLSPTPSQALSQGTR